jgi:uncharacterized DUF497 family protein
MFRLAMCIIMCIVIVHTETASEIRVISMRKGTANEQEIFFENI